MPQEVCIGRQRLPFVEPDSDGKYKCWICLEDSADRHEFIRPCKCRATVHRACLDQWRFANINPVAHLKCERCYFEFQMEGPENVAVSDSVRKLYFRQLLVGLLKFWSIIILIVFGSSALIGLFLYGIDGGKNIPAIIKYSFVSIFNSDAVEIAESAKKYREELRDHFALADVRVWPYYLASGFCFASIIFGAISFYFFSTLNLGLILALSLASASAHPLAQPLIHLPTFETFSLSLTSRHLLKPNLFAVS